VKYDAAMDQFIFNWKIPKGGPIGTATLKVDVAYGAAMDSHSLTISIAK
jgi:hypothetical protein